MKNIKILEYDKIREQLINQCQTTIAKESAQNLEPSGIFFEVENRLIETNEAVKIFEVASPPLADVKDIRDALKRLTIGRILEIAEVIDIRSTMSAMRDIKKFFKEIDFDSPMLKSRANQIEILGNLEQRIDRTIDEHGNIRDNASIELNKIRNDLRTAQSRIKERLMSIIQNPANQKYFQEAIVTVRGDRYVIPIKQEYRREIQGLVHDQSATGATLFIEPMAIVELGNTIRQLVIAERNEIQRILRILSNEINKNQSILSFNAEILSSIDFAFAKAKLAQVMNATQPLINDEGRTKIYQARHPLIDVDKVVPINLFIGDSYKMLLITGPNTGGKTVALKTMGLMAMMCQSGLYIPAEVGSEISIYKNIYSVIGDEQSIEQSLSTFSAHMSQLVAILNQVTVDDLVLLDELAAGTDPEEGSALAQSILEKLLEIGATTLATTHYSELKTFAYSNDGIKNASVEFDVNSLKPTYRLMIGISGASNAFAISERLGLSKEIISNAKSMMTAEHENFDQIVKTLENERKLYEQRNSELAIKQQSLIKKENQLNELRDELNKNKAEILRKAKDKSSALIRKTKREAEEIIESLKEQFDDLGVKRRQQAIQEARDKLNQASESMAEGIINQKLGKRIDKENLLIGDTVYITKLDQKGIIQFISSDDKELTVQVGALTVNVKRSNCRFISHGNTTDEIPSNSNSSTKKTTGALLNIATNIQREIDVRGMMVNEAESILSKFIDNAQLTGLKTILIIHGKGTGALRKGIHEYLRGNRSVKDFQFADIDEGGTGATVVNIK